MQSEQIFVFDLELPPEFQPRNEDGEVAEFQRVTMAQVLLHLGSGGGMTLDASLVALNFLRQRDYLRVCDTRSGAG